MKAKIHYMDTGGYYVAESEEDCWNDAEKSAYRTAKNHGKTISMGMICVEPMKYPTNPSETRNQ